MSLHVVGVAMNVYDFDKTIYRGDSTIDFWIYCLRKHPSIAAFGLRQLAAAARHALGSIDARRLKEEFFSFLTALDRPEACVAAFWEANDHKIKAWYLNQKQPSDIIISASPEFLLRPVCRALGVASPIATRVDETSWKIHGANCKGAEKVVRFRERFPDGRIQQFYSDSLSDTPLAELAEQAFLVKRNTVQPWPKLKGASA